MLLLFPLPKNTPICLRCSFFWNLPFSTAVSASYDILTRAFLSSGSSSFGVFSITSLSAFSQLQPDAGNTVGFSSWSVLAIAMPEIKACPAFTSGKWIFNIPPFTMAYTTFLQTPSWPLSAQISKSSNTTESFTATSNIRSPSQSVEALPPVPCHGSVKYSSIRYVPSATGKRYSSWWRPKRKCWNNVQSRVPRIGSLVVRWLAR